MDDLKLYSKSEKALDSLIQTVTIFSKDIGMQFGIDKCAMLVMKKGRIVKSDGIQLPNDKVIKTLEEGQSYKYLGLLEAGEVMVNGMKDKVKKEYYRRVRKVLETKLDSGNVFKAINSRAVSVVRYSAAFLRWWRLQLDRGTRKLLTMQNGFHPKSNVDRLYLSRSEGSRRLTGVQDTVETAILTLTSSVRNSKERSLIAAQTIEEGEDGKTPNEYKKEEKEWEENTVDTKTITRTIYQANNG